MKGVLAFGDGESPDRSLDAYSPPDPENFGFNAQISSVSPLATVAIASSCGLLAFLVRFSGRRGQLGSIQGRRSAGSTGGDRRRIGTLVHATLGSHSLHGWHRADMRDPQPWTGLGFGCKSDWASDPLGVGLQVRRGGQQGAAKFPE